MVLELKVPNGGGLHELTKLFPVFLSYILSFIYIGIYWSNHHHLFQVAKQVTGGVLWANLHLMFWLSLLPFVTGWAGENNFAAVPMAFYGLVLLMSSIAYFILARLLVNNHGERSKIAKAISDDKKGKISTLIYIAGIAATLVSPMISIGLYTIVAMIWIIPDRRIEKVVDAKAD